MKSRLQTFTPADQQAFALAGMALLDAVNAGLLVVSDQVGPEKADQTIVMLDLLYVLQDAIHGGNAGNVQKALAALCESKGGVL